jgi:ferredoxin
MNEKIKVQVRDREGNLRVLLIEPGTNLREALIANGLSPYEGTFKKLNCKGMGICGTCKVLVREEEVDWEKRSCQIQCFQELEIRLK